MRRVPSSTTIRHIAKNLQRLKESRQFQLKEVPLEDSTGHIHEPASHEWKSVSQIQSAALGSDDAPMRYFEGMVDSQTFLAVPRGAAPPAASKKKKGLPPPPQKSRKAQKRTLMDAATGFDKIVANTEGLSENHLVLLRRLTMAMVWASKATKEAVEEVFSWLRRVEMEGSPEMFKLITPYGWKFLWALEEDPRGIPSYRTRLIGDLMVRAGAPMDVQQKVAYIGGLFWNEGRDQAMEIWEDLVKKVPSFETYSVGIRMLSLEGNPARAEEKVWEMINVLGSAEPKTWVPVIMSYCRFGDPEKAWKTYEYMQISSRKSITPITADQFDTLAMSFLDNGNPRMGLEIYRHMIFSGIPEEEVQTSVTYQNLSTAILSAMDEARNPVDLNRLSRDAMHNLPKSVQDRHFFAGWMLNLMKMGRVDLAYRLVCGAMEGEGILPEPVMGNWIVQAFFEYDNPEMAIKVSDEMIQRRLKASKKPHKPLNSVHYTPPATVETFSILITYFSRRSRFDQILNYVNLMHDCKIQPNTYIFNHRLYSLFRTSQFPELSKSFLQCPVNPDMETFAVMWTATWKRYTQNYRRFDEFLTPRQLFRATVEKWPKKQKDDDAPRLEKIWHAIMKAFFVSRDLHGALLALYAASTLFGVQVDDTIVRTVAFGVLKSRTWNYDPELTAGRRPKVLREDIGNAVSELEEFGQKLLEADVGRTRRGGRVLKDPKSWVPSAGLDTLIILLKNEIGDGYLATRDLEVAREDMGLMKVRMDKLEL